MGYELTKQEFASLCKEWSKTYDIYAPMVFEGTGRFSQTDVIRYGKCTDPDKIVWDARSEYSFKDVLTPICQILFYFTEHEVKEAEFPEKGAIVFLRSCDLHAVKRLDYMFLKNGPEDYYYKTLRDKVKFVLMSFDAGTGLSEHAAPGDALVFALDGEATITYEGVENLVRAGQTFKFDAGGRHAVRADRRFKMALLVTLA